MRNKEKARLEVEDHGSTLLVRVDGGPYGLFGLDIAAQLDELVNRADKDPNIHAVVFTGAHPSRFVSHADVRWLQEGGAEVPSVGRRGAAAAGRRRQVRDGPGVARRPRRRRTTWRHGRRWRWPWRRS